MPIIEQGKKNTEVHKKANKKTELAGGMGPASSGKKCNIYVDSTELN